MSGTARDFEAALRLSAIVESSDDAIVSKDLNGIVMSWNRAAERMFGYTADEMIGRSITGIIPIERLGEEDHVLDAVRRGVGVDHYETQRRHKDGHLIDVSLTVSPVRDRDGTIIGASKIARDIGERNRLLAELERANRSKDEFLATLSHELRTPLNSILGYARLLRAGMIDNGARGRAIETIERNAVSLAQLVADVLDVSRIVTGKMRFAVEPCNVGELMEGALDSMAPAIASKEIALTREIARDAGPVTGDPDRLQQVFWNLLSNAVKFTPRGGRIWIEVRRADDGVVVVVRDNGKGIAPELLPHVFDRFSQGDSSTTREVGGLGLGLAIVRHYVEMHAGRVMAFSNGAEAGAEFTVHLPFAASQGTGGPA